MTLSRPIWLRAIVGTAVLCAAPVIAIAALFLRRPTESTGVLGLAMIGVSAIAAMPLFRGRWDRDAFVVQGFFTVVLLVGYAAVAVTAAFEAQEALASRADYGTSAAVCAAWIALAGGAMFLAALVVATVPVRVERRVLVRVVGVLAAVGFGGAGVVVAVASTDSCERFRFDRAAWDRNPTAVAEGLSGCHTLDGMTEDELGQLLGPTSRGQRGTVWLGESLYVRIGEDGRVHETWASSPADDQWLD